MKEYYYDDINDAKSYSSDEHWDGIREKEAEIEILKGDIENIQETLSQCQKFLASLMHPEELGWSVTQEVREKARALLSKIGDYDGKNGNYC